MTPRTLTAAVALATTVLVACGDDGGGGDDATTTTTTATDPVPVETAADDGTATTAALPPVTTEPDAATADAAGEVGAGTTPDTATRGGDGTAGDGAEVGDEDAGDLSGEEAAIADVFRTVFDSSVPAADKLDVVEDGGELVGTLDEYVQAADAVGGITLEPTDVVVDGQTAAVTYDVLFAGTVQYEGQEGQAINAGGEWIVSREQLCGFLAAARVSCP